MAHDNHWKKTWDEAHKRLVKLFDESKMKIADVIGDDNGIDSLEDAKKVLVFVHKHRPSPEELVCATLSVVESLMAWHELNEHAKGEETISARAGVLVK